MANDSQPEEKSVQKCLQPVNREAIYLDTILRKMSDAVLFIDLEGTIGVVNEMAQKLLQVNSQDLLRTSYWGHFSDEYFGFSMREALKFGISHGPLYKTIPIERKEVEISTNFVFDGPKFYHGIILIIKDISEKKRWQLIANCNDRMKELGQVAATVAHEIRNPLGGVRGYASLLYRDLEQNPHLQEMAGLILDGTKRLEKMVLSILHYSRPVEIETQTIELGSFLKQFGKFIKADPAISENTKLCLHIPDAPILAPIDAEALKSALLNLVYNGIQAMPYGGTLTISLLKMETSYQIAISDTGMGMEEKMLKQLFSPFFTTKERGNGLGLVETQKIVQAHFGTIHVRSQQGVGTTFTLILPLKR